MQELSRRRHAPSFTFGAVALLVTACGDAGDPSGNPERIEPPDVAKASEQSRELNPRVDGRDLTTLVAGNTAFALNMFNRLRSSSQNVAVGPYSISQAMAMLYAGARGVTELELRSVLGFGVDAARVHPTFNGLDLELQSRNPDIFLRNANQVWLDRGFSPLPEFLDVMTGDYGAPLAVVDFAGDAEAARSTINDWVSQVTEEKISELFPAGSIDGTTVLALTNAMYMDAPWKYTFDAAATRPAEFYLLDGSSIQVPMMHFNDFLPSAAGDSWQAVELPYRGDEVSMFVVVPEDLQAFEYSLTPARLDEIIGAIRDGGIHLSMPRFSFRFHASLIEQLTALGLDSLSAPDLSGIAPGGLQVQSIEHEAFIEVDEEGTRAAAATGVSVAESHGPTVSVDRPFVFFIVDKPTRSVLFLGHVVDPSQ